MDWRVSLSLFVFYRITNEPSISTLMRLRISNLAVLNYLPNLTDASYKTKQSICLGRASCRYPSTRLLQLVRFSGSFSPNYSIKTFPKS